MRRGVVIVVVALAARTSQAAELRSGLTGSAQYNTNAQSAGESSEGGGGGDVRLDGQAQLDLSSDPDQRLRWRLGYRPTYERFLDLQELDNWRHRATAGFTYGLTRKTTLGGNASFTRTTRTTLEDLDVEPPDPEPTLVETDEQVDRGSLGLSLSHSFGPRWSGSGSAGYSFTDYAQADRSDFEAATASASLSYTMTARQSLGGGLSLSRQIVKEADLQTASGEISTQAEQETRFASLFGSWNYRLSPLWRLDLQAGPTLIDTDLQDTAPLLVPRVPSLAFEIPTDPPTVVQFPFDSAKCSTAPCEQTDILQTPLPAGFQNPEVEPDTSEFLGQQTSNTVFANFGIVRDGEETRFRLAYSRSAGENFGGRVSTISDVLSSTWSWRPDADWSVESRASYSRQQQASTTPVFEGFPLVANAGTVPGIPDDAAIIDVAPDGSARVLTGEADDAFGWESWGVFLRVTRRITRHFSGSVRLRYVDQKNNGLESGVVEDLDNFEIGLGVSYSFDPIRF